MIKFLLAANKQKLLISRPVKFKSVLSARASYFRHFAPVFRLSKTKIITERVDDFLTVSFTMPRAILLSFDENTFPALVIQNWRQKTYRRSHHKKRPHPFRTLHSLLRRYVGYSGKWCQNYNNNLQVSHQVKLLMFGLHRTHLNL